MSKVISFALVILFFSSELFAVGIFDKLSEKQWRGSGTLMGSKATFEMSWKAVLNSQFMHLHFSNNRLLKDNVSYSFSAHAYYKIINNNEIEGTWFDSRGTTFPLTGFIKADTLTINWGTKATEQGRTTYKAINQNKIEVLDFVLKDGQYVQFGKATYQ